MKIPPVIRRLWADAHRRGMDLEHYLLEVLEVAASELHDVDGAPMPVVEGEQWQHIRAFFTGRGSRQLRAFRRFVRELAGTPCLCVGKEVTCWACRAQRLLRGEGDGSQD